MWNRVVLLCAGVATGWTAVNILTCPRPLVRGQRVRLAISVSLAAATIVWLSLDSPAPALLGLGVYLLAAVPAFVANAQQASTSKPDPGPPPPLSSAAPDAHTENKGNHILLISPGPPPQYSGPAGWAYRLMHTDNAPTTLPRRIVFPWTLAHVRQAYDAMPNGHPSTRCCSHVARRLSCRSPENNPRCVYLQGSPHLRQELRSLRQKPPTPLTLILLDAPGSGSEDRVREIITSSRLRETIPDLRLVHCPPRDVDNVSDLAPLLQGSPAPMPDHEQLSAYADAVLASLETR